MTTIEKLSGILLIDKPKGKMSFSLVSRLRKLLGVKKIGHAGTLDPFATGVMVMLIGKEFTKLSDTFLANDKEYIATLKLGVTTDSYDCDGEISNTSDFIPSQEMIEAAVAKFQGKISQIPPMFSAKKIQGKKLYDLARKGVTIERQPVEVMVKTTLIEYNYPFLILNVYCSKGTYIRSIADELGKILTCGAHLIDLKRTKSGAFTIDQCLDGKILYEENCDISEVVKSILL